MTFWPLKSHFQGQIGPNIAKFRWLLGLRPRPRLFPLDIRGKKPRNFRFTVSVNFWSIKRPKQKLLDIQFQSATWGGGCSGGPSLESGFDGSRELYSYLLRRGFRGGGCFIRAAIAPPPALQRGALPPPAFWKYLIFFFNFGRFWGKNSPKMFYFANFFRLAALASPVFLYFLPNKPNYYL